MWLVVGQLASQMLINNPDNVILQLFIRFTEPFYASCAKDIVPFLRMSEEKKATGMAEGSTAGQRSFLIATTYILLRPLLRGS